MDLREIDLGKLNSLTKYPSIPTFHMLGEKGRLTEQSLPLPVTDIIGTEKIDGTNARIILRPARWDGPCWLLGSREELLCAEGDLIGDPALGIVKALREIADRLVNFTLRDECLDSLTVFFCEVYGGKVTASSRNYTKTGAVGFRLFDIMSCEQERAEEMIANMSREQIAGWRDSGGQSFLPEDKMRDMAATIGVERTPRILPAYPLPPDLAGAHKWLRDLLPGKTYADLDRNGDGGRPEGAVIRTLDRGFIAKLRFEDYERTLR